VDKPVLFRQFNLSRSKSLRTLETTAESVTIAGDAALDSLRTILSTTTSPVLLDLVIVYWDSDVDINLDREPELEYRAACALRHQHRFTVFRGMHGARAFRLVLCADVLDETVESATGMLKQLVKAEKVRGGWSYLHCEPSVIAERRSSRARPIDSRPGSVDRRLVCASAL